MLEILQERLPPTEISGITAIREIIMKKLEFMRNYKYM